MRGWLLGLFCLSFLAAEPRLAPVATPGKWGYPPLARICRVEGTVRLDVTIDAQGLPTKVVPADGPQVLRPSALAYVSGMRFLAQEAGGAAFPLTLPYAMPFHLPQVESASPLPPIEGTSLRIDAPRSLDTAPLEAMVRRRLEEAGLPPGASRTADAWRTLLVDLEVETFGLGGGAKGYALLLRCSRKVDKGLDPVADPREGRAWSRGRAGALRGREITASCLAEPLDALLAELVGAESNPVGVKRVRDGVVLIGDKGRMGMDAIYQFDSLKVRSEPFTPSFPSKAFARKWSGTVDLELALDASGQPVEARMIWGDPVFQEAAVRNAMALAFEVEGPRTVTLTMAFVPGYWQVVRHPPALP